MAGFRPGCPVGEPMAAGGALRVAVPAAGPEFCAAGSAGVAAGSDVATPGFGAPTGAVGAIRAGPELPGVAGSIGNAVGAGAGVAAVPDGENVDDDSGLLLKRTLAPELGDAVGVATDAG